MTTFLLDQVEADVLAALRDERWQSYTEVAEETGVHVQLVRSKLRQLALRRLVERGGWGESVRWGQHRITEAGLAELRKRDQLRLVV